MGGDQVNSCLYVWLWEGVVFGAITGNVMHMKKELVLESNDVIDFFPSQTTVELNNFKALAQGLHHLQWAGPFHINHSSRNCATRFDRSDGGSSPMEVALPWWLYFVSSWQKWTSVAMHELDTLVDDNIKRLDTLEHVAMIRSLEDRVGAKWVFSLLGFWLLKLPLLS